MKHWFGFLFLVFAALNARAQTPAHGQSWRYLLLDGAALMDDCSACDRLTFWQPLTGSFELNGTSTPFRYELRNINFVGDPNGLDFQITGQGILSFESGDAELTLDLAVKREDFIEVVHLTNVLSDQTRIFPMIGAEASAPPAPGHYYRVRLFAAPIREFWFSTVASFTRGAIGIPEESAMSHGDLLAHTGRVVKRNAALTERLSIPPGDIGLDATALGLRGEILFSSTTDAESIVNGPLGHGDILSAAGRLYLQNSQLLSPFGVTETIVGLDALHYVAEDELYFSIAKEVPRATGGTLRSGDILSSLGRIIRPEATLLLRFINPLTTSVGVDALHVWPNGEIWFSTQTAFTNSSLGAISAGDILSDQGYIALRNADILSSFAPIENADLGLDALLVISDAAASSVPLQITSIDVTTEGIDLRWESAGRAFQLERADAVEGPYSPITPIIVERRAHDFETSATTAFYRVRQW